MFVCKYNRFRSRVAERYFNQLNKNPGYKAKSAGIIKWSSIDKFQRKVCKSAGINIAGFPQGLSTKLMKWQNIVIIVANDVPPIIFRDNKKYGKQLLIWSIPDAEKDSVKEVERIVNIIKKKVSILVKMQK